MIWQEEGSIEQARAKGGGTCEEGEGRDINNTRIKEEKNEEN